MSYVSSQVEILLATYNGGLYLKDQIDSILSQNYSNLSILVRDDGSKDETLSLIKDYKTRYPQRFLLAEDHIPTGHPKRNFLRLMKASTAEYLCFSDQDDVWLPEKVSRSMQAMRRLEDLHGQATPALVFTDLKVVDERLSTLDDSYWRRSGINPNDIYRLSRLLSENVVTGCTMMINRSLCRLAQQMPEEAEMHDWWIALIASVFGAVEIVPERTILYRQHAANVVGSRDQSLTMENLSTRIQPNNRRLQRARCERQAEAFLRIYGSQISVEKRKIFEAYLLSGRSESAWIRVKTMFQYGFFRSSLPKTIATAIDLVRARSPLFPKEDSPSA
jgi:hypothetical protein